MPEIPTRIVLSWFGPITVTVDEDLAPYRPCRKVRGQRRYYRTLARDAVDVTVHRGEWYDRMHWHVDWTGLGNLSWRARRSHLAALFAMFRHVLAVTADWAEPHQVWLQIDAADSSQDAVYLHTPNPNRGPGSAFPADLSWVTWDAPVPERLAEFLTDPAWQFGRAESHWTHFLVRPRNAA